MLWTIWAVSLTLAGLSLLVMAGLVVARTFSERRRARETARRDALLARVVGWLSGECPDGEVVAALGADVALSADLLGELFEMVRGAEQLRLAALAEEAGVVTHLRAGLRRRAPAARLAAAETLTWFPSPETHAELERTLRDPDPEVALAAAAALAELGSDLPVQALLGVRFDRSDPSRRLEIVVARVAKRRPAELAELAADAARTDRLRVAALDALAGAGAVEAVSAAQALVHAASVEIRVACARTLGMLGHPGVAPTVAHLLADPHWAVRAKAAETAGRLELLDLAEALTPLLADENWWVRHRAGEAITRLGETGLELLKDIAARGVDDPAGVIARLLSERDAA